MGLSRRDFLMRVGQAGGYSAAFVAMQGLGLVEHRAVAQARIEAAPGSGNGTTVVILGGGISGLVAAYELRALGYQCTVLEARSRPGGRNWTVRGGDSVVLNGMAAQRCTWDTGHYQNFGPARLPSIHTHMLNYCRKLGVELQVEVNMTNSAFLQNDKANDGKAATMRQVANDTRGHVSELLMKCINAGALDAEITSADRERMMDFLSTYGPLNDAGSYIGDDRAGYSRTPGAGDEAGVLSVPLDMHTLLDANFWEGLLFDQAFDQQATMFQPVGGMDRIPYAFAKSLGSLVKYNSIVSEIRKTSHGVVVSYVEGGDKKSIQADYCLCGLPLTILRNIPNDLTESHQKVVRESEYAHAYKVAWESRRFWEEDYNIYGGLEFCNVGCSPIWFPSAGMFTDRGVVVSGYTDELDSSFATLSYREKLEESRKSMERLHPGHGKELEKPMYVGWGRVSFNEGSWIQSYGSGDSLYKKDKHGRRKRVNSAQAPGIVQKGSTGGEKQPTAAATETNGAYEALIQPDWPIMLIGDHTSHLVGWQEGAALSALRAVQAISDHVKATKLASAPSRMNQS